MDGSSSKAVERRRLIFQVGDQRHEIDAGLVLEIVRVPHLTRVPHGPAALQGIANLRGRPVPVLSMSSILVGGEKAAQPNGKIIIYDHAGAVGLLVDDVIRLSADVTAMPLQGLDGLLDAAFKVARRAHVERPAHSARETAGQTVADLSPFLSFQVAGQLYGLPLEHIREVATLAGDIASIANAAEAVIGLMPMRGSVLPLVSLASLMGLEPGHRSKEGSRIVIVEHEGDLVGLVVDEMDVIHRLPRAAIDAVPAMLQKGRGDAQIDAIGRIAETGLLMSILSPEKLFGHHAVTQVTAQNRGAGPMGAAPEKEDAVEQFLIFQLGEENYGLPIISVDEVIRIPDEISRMPGAPAFVMGVINRRGRAVALIDQRSRFDAPVSAQTTKARAIIVTIGKLQAGFVVDSVSEVKAVPVAALSAAPEFSSDRTDVFDRIAHIEADGRMILLVDPQALLTRAEQDMVAAIAQEKTVVTDP